MPVFLLSTIRSLMHYMIYSLISSRTSKGLSLGELIRAFCIIIIASYRGCFHGYWHWYYFIFAFLDDFRDFPPKFPLFLFNICEAENLLFSILMFQGPSRLQKDWGFFCANIFGREAPGAEESDEGGQEVQDGPTGAASLLVCASRAHLAPKRPLAFVFYGWLRPERKIAPYFSWYFLRRRRRRRRNPSSTSGRVRSSCPATATGGKSPPSSPQTPPWRGRSFFITIFIIYISTIITTISTSWFDIIPLIVCGRSIPGYCFSVVCMLVLSNLSLFRGEVIFSDCVVLIMPLVMIMIDTCE